MVYRKEFPQQELDTVDQFAARVGVSGRTVMRREKDGLRLIRIGRTVRVDPIVAMAWWKGERPPPPKRGRPRKQAQRKVTP
jgi:hypothetical protein